VQTYPPCWHADGEVQVNGWVKPQQTSPAAHVWVSQTGPLPPDPEPLVELLPPLPPLELDPPLPALPLLLVPVPPAAPPLEAPELDPEDELEDEEPPASAGVPFPPSPALRPPEEPPQAATTPLTRTTRAMRDRRKDEDMVLVDGRSAVLPPRNRALLRKWKVEEQP
jgi:hypothetical protein